MIDIKMLGERIKELRQKRGLTQGQFAENLFVSFQAVSNWERGLAPPDLENLVRIAAFFGVLVDELLCPQNDRLFLGIDGGGTKTEFAVVTSDGHILKELVREGCNPNDIGFQKTVTLLSEGIRDMLVDFPTIETIFCGIAGITAGNYRDRVSSELNRNYPRIKIAIKSDSYNLFAMDENAGMSVISGTGSVVFVRHKDSHIRIGGWGYLLDNAGSAYDIGREAIRIGLAEEDQKKAGSTLSKLLYQRIGTETVWEHIGQIYSGGRPYIASFAPIVFEAYAQGDQNSISIIDSNAKALASMMNTAVALYGVNPVAIANGGLFTHYGDIMKSHIQKYSNVDLRITGLPPVCGACRAALRLADEHPKDDFDINFKRTYGGTPT